MLRLLFPVHKGDYNNDVSTIFKHYLLPDELLLELLFLDELELLFEFDDRLGAAFVEPPDERLGAAFVEPPDERLGAAFVEPPDDRLGVVLVEPPDDRLGAVLVEPPDERLGVVLVEPPDERFGVVEDGFLVPVLDDGLVVVDELRDGVDPATLASDCLVAVLPEFCTDVFDELLVPLPDDGRVELFELRDGVTLGRA
jgi:hypothetical protein